MLDTPDNDTLSGIELPHYDRAQLLLEKLHAWAKAGFPGATLADLARIASNQLPEKRLTAVRKRAEHNCNAMLGIRPRRARRMPPAVRAKVRAWLRSQETK